MLLEMQQFNPAAFLDYYCWNYSGITALTKLNNVITILGALSMIKKIINKPRLFMKNNPTGIHSL